MENVSHKKTWNSEMTQAHVEHPTTPLIKIKHGDKSYKDFVKLKLCRDTTSDTLYLYDFKMDFFDSGNPEELLLLVQNFNITIAASGNLATSANI